MPKYKMLRGEAHNLGHSFLSLMNYLKYGYCLNYLCAISRIEKTNAMEIDFLKCSLNPGCFNLRELINSVYSYGQTFNNRLIELGINQIEIKSVKMKVKFDNKIKRITKSHKFYSNILSEVSIKLKNGKNMIILFA